MFYKGYFKKNSGNSHIH